MLLLLTQEKKRQSRRADQAGRLLIIDRGDRIESDRRGVDRAPKQRVTSATAIICINQSFAPSILLQISLCVCVCVDTKK
jgi:hypothetical protein